MHGVVNLECRRFVASGVCIKWKSVFKTYPDPLSEGVTVQQLHELTMGSFCPLLQAKLVSEFDTHVTVPLFGFSCLEDYYKSCKNADKIHKIRKPFVCITSADDPFVPEECESFNYCFTMSVCA